MIRCSNSIAKKAAACGSTSPPCCRALRAGQMREVTLVALAGKRRVYGFGQEVMGKLER
jgi:urease beta subunit